MAVAELAVGATTGIAGMDIDLGASRPTRLGGVASATGFDANRGSREGA
jgi:hypothetical protein